MLPKEIQKFLDEIPDVVFLVDEKNRYLFLNKAIEMLLGYKPEELVGKYRPDFSANKQRAEEQLKEILANKKPIREEMSFYRKNGEKVTVEHILTPIQENGKVKYILGVARDITELKKAREELISSEEKYRSLVEFTDDSIYLVDRECRYLFMNGKHLSRLGVSLEEVVGKSYADFHSEEESKEFERLIEEVFKTSEPLQHEHKSLRDGRWFLRTLSPVKNKEGETIAVTVVSKNIDLLKKVEKELKAKTEELESFIYRVSHDLRAPLITIQGFVELLRKDIERKDEEKIKEDLEMIENGISRMNRYINELLHLSRIGRVINPPKELNFGEVVEKALIILEEKIKSKNIEVKTSNNFPTVKVDCERMVEALVNIIDNSIKYMGSQPKPKIEIGYYMDQKTKEDVFFVKDNGSGIDAMEHEKIFQLFYRGRESSGSGVGLTIVKKIIEHHGGRVWVESERGRGCTLYFTLPRKNGGKSRCNSLGRG